MAPYPKWTGEELRVLTALFKACEQLRVVDEYMTVANLHAVVAVAEREAKREPPLTVSELGDRVSGQSNMSRILKVLGEGSDARGRRAGLGLTRTIDDEPGRRGVPKPTELTPYGRQLVRDIVRSLQVASMRRDN